MENVMLPNVTRIGDIFKSWELQPINIGNGHYRDEIAIMRNYNMFISQRVTIGDKSIHFGNFKNHIGIRVDKNKKFFCFTSYGPVGTYGTYGKLQNSIRESIMNCYCYSNQYYIEDNYSFEIINRNDGKTLISARDGNYVGAEKLALIDTEQFKKDCLEIYQKVDLDMVNDYYEREKFVKSFVDGDNVDIDKAIASGIKIKFD